MGIAAWLQLRDWLPTFALAALCAWLPKLMLATLSPVIQLCAGFALSLALFLGILRLCAPSTLRDALYLGRQLTHAKQAQ
jgi:hypothetical protein